MTTADMSQLADAIWLRLKTVLTIFSDQLHAIDPTLKLDLERTADDPSVLKVYLRIKKFNHGDELDIVIDIQEQANGLAVMSGIRIGDGETMADGPATTISFSASAGIIGLTLSNWFSSFEHFLIESETKIIPAICCFT